MDTPPELTEGQADAIVASVTDELAVSPTERRQGARLAFPVVQRVAPYGCDGMPAESQFCRVEFRDISGRGCSFFWPTSPDFTHVIAGLGSPPHLTYVTARVVRCTPAPEPETGFLVGCRFLGRIRPPLEI